MMNREALRDRYEKYWPLSNKREKMIKKMLEDALGVKVEPYGLGAMSTERIKGSARDNGFETADPDLYVTEYDFFVEVTGPIPLYIHPKDGLFVNPDKVRNARKKAAQGKDVWLVHILDRSGVREQILSLVGDVLPEEVKTSLRCCYLTDLARCRLGRLCARTKDDESKSLLVEKVLFYHDNNTLVTRANNEKTIIRCFLMDEEFAEKFADEAKVRIKGEKFISVPSGDERVMSFDKMISVVKSRCSS